VLLQRAELFGKLTAAGVIDGMHSEGPFLSIKAKGAQSPDFLIPGDPQLVRDMAAAAGGALKTMTVAPEIENVAGSGGVAETLINVGAIPSLGHTACTQTEAETLINQVTSQLAGTGKMMTVTHMFNGMPPLHHRSPGPLPACIAAAAQGRIMAELICDGVHLDPDLVRAMHTHHHRARQYCFGYRCDGSCWHGGWGVSVRPDGGYSWWRGGAVGQPR